MAATYVPLSTPRRDETQREAIARAQRDEGRGRLHVSLAECLLARHGDARPKDPTARLMLMVAKRVAR